MKTQDHDAVLDGLRGFAAIAVLVFHLGHWFGIPGLASGGGLAVDFFFCLSGYVLAMVYRDRLDAGWGFGRFFEARLIRLMPLIVVGTLISAAYVAFRMFVKHESGGHGALAMATLLGLANLPYFTAPTMIGGPQVFPLNGPQYSLFLEIIVNAFWASAIVLRGRAAAVLLAVLGLIGVAVFGLGGDQASTFWSGLPRVFGSFYLGALAYEVGPWIRAKSPHLFPFGIVAMAGLFLWPNALPMPVVLLWIALISPLVVISGAGVRLPERARPVALLLGRLSFPIYALHYPLFCWINGVVQAKTHRQLPAIEIPLILIAVPLLAWLLLVLYDEPLREALSRRTKARMASRARELPGDRPASS
jgi:peptidoglycan/LPS O-acetylase OafA/YrhL